MIPEIVKIEKEGKNYLLFNKRGMVLELSSKEYSIFSRFARQKRFPSLHKEFFNRLCSYEMTSFNGYKARKVPVEYSQKLLNHNSPEPVFKSPIVAHLGLTSSCNMGCKYCSVRKPYNKVSELSTAEWKKVIGKLAGLGVFQIGFTGGEPTLRKDIVELAKHVTKNKCTFNLTTNGWNLDEKLIVSLKKEGMRQCQVSLDCHIPAVNDRLRGKNSFEHACYAIKLLKRNGIVVGIDCVVSKNNLPHITEFVRWLSKEDIPYLTLIKIKQGDLSLETFKRLYPGYFEYGKVIEQICSRENVMPCVTLDCGSVSNLQYTLNDDELRKVPIAGCPAGHTLLSIAPNGDIYPCVALGSPEFYIGNALKDDLNHLWNDNTILQELRQVKSEVKGRCKDCSRLDHCRAGCRGIAYSLYNDVWESDKTCRR
ncbi:MAG: radical SAM protein [Nanoarchaeota archaeon]|nr:radical SAM protein [Nanoarchaeota archaeon]